MIKLGFIAASSEYPSPQPIHVTRGEGLDQEVGVLYQILEMASPFGSTQIKSDASLIGGISPPEEAFLWVIFVVVKWADFPGGTASWGLYLNHIGAEVRPESCRIKAPFHL